MTPVDDYRRWQDRIIQEIEELEKEKTARSTRAIDVQIAKLLKQRRFRKNLEVLGLSPEQFMEDLKKRLLEESGA